MKDTGYGKGYQYAHNYEQAITDMQCLPDELRGKTYYSPSDKGNEKELKERLERIKQWKMRNKQ
jgi:putative ATPase